jgi:hypothetical protein
VHGAVQAPNLIAFMVVVAASVAAIAATDRKNVAG